MATLLKISLLPNVTDQFLSIEIDENPYILRVLWNERFGYFSLSVFEADNTPILVNVKMVKNYPITEQFKDTRLPFGSFYFVQEKGTNERPTFEDLAVNCNLYYYEKDIIPTAQLVVG